MPPDDTATSTPNPYNPDPNPNPKPTPNQAVRSDRNLYAKNQIEAQEEIAEMKRKFVNPESLPHRYPYP